MSTLLEQLVGRGLIDSQDLGTSDISGAGLLDAGIRLDPLIPTVDRNQRLQQQLDASLLRTQALDELNSRFTAENQRSTKAAQADADRIARETEFADAALAQIEAETFGDIDEKDREEFKKLNPGLVAASKEIAAKKYIQQLQQIAFESGEEADFERVGAAKQAAQSILEEREQFFTQEDAQKMYDDLNLEEALRTPNTTAGGIVRDVFGKVVAGVGASIDLAGSVTGLDPLTSWATGGSFEGVGNAIGNAITGVGEDIQQDSFGELLSNERLSAVKAQYDNKEIGAFDLGVKTLGALGTDGFLNVATSIFGVAGSGGALSGGSKAINAAKELKNIKKTVDAAAGIKPGVKGLRDDVAERLDQAESGFRGALSRTDASFGAAPAAGFAGNALEFQKQEFDEQGGLAQTGAAAVAAGTGVLGGLIPGTLERQILRADGKGVSGGLGRRDLNVAPVDGVVARTGQAVAGAAGGAVRTGSREFAEEGIQGVGVQASNRLSDAQEFDTGSLIQETAIGTAFGTGSGAVTGATRAAGLNPANDLQTEFDRIKQDNETQGVTQSDEVVADLARANVAAARAATEDAVANPTPEPDPVERDTAGFAEGDVVTAGGQQATVVGFKDGFREGEAAFMVLSPVDNPDQTFEVPLSNEEQNQAIRETIVRPEAVETSPEAPVEEPVVTEAGTPPPVPREPGVPPPIPETVTPEPVVEEEIIDSDVDPAGSASQLDSIVRDLEQPDDPSDSTSDGRRLNSLKRMKAAVEGRVRKLTGIKTTTQSATGLSNDVATFEAEENRILVRDAIRRGDEATLADLQGLQPLFDAQEAATAVVSAMDDNSSGFPADQNNVAVDEVASILPESLGDEAARLNLAQGLFTATGATGTRTKVDLRRQLASQETAADGPGYLQQIRDSLVTRSVPVRENIIAAYDQEIAGLEGGGTVEAGSGVIPTAIRVKGEQLAAKTSLDINPDNLFKETLKDTPSKDLVPEGESPSNYTDTQALGVVLKLYGEGNALPENTEGFVSAKANGSDKKGLSVRQMAPNPGESRSDSPIPSITETKGGGKFVAYRFGSKKSTPSIAGPVHYAMGKLSDDGITKLIDVPFGHADRIKHNGKNPPKGSNADQNLAPIKVHYIQDPEAFGANNEGVQMFGTIPTPEGMTPQEALAAMKGTPKQRAAVAGYRAAVMNEVFDGFYPLVPRLKAGVQGSLTNPSKNPNINQKVSNLLDFYFEHTGQIDPKTSAEGQKSPTAPSTPTSQSVGASTSATGQTPLPGNQTPSSRNAGVTGNAIPAPPVNTSESLVELIDDYIGIENVKERIDLLNGREKNRLTKNIGRISNTLRLVENTPQSEIDDRTAKFYARRRSSDDNEVYAKIKKVLDPVAERYGVDASDINYGSLVDMQAAGLTSAEKVSKGGRTAASANMYFKMVGISDDLGMRILNSDNISAKDTETLVHEMFHILTPQIFKSATGKEMTEFLQGYTDWFIDNRNTVAQAIADDIVTPNRQRYTKGDRGYALSVAEYVAERGANSELNSLLNNTGNPAGIFPKLFNMLKDIYDSVSTAFNIDGNFDDMLAAMRVRVAAEKLRNAEAEDTDTSGTGATPPVTVTQEQKGQSPSGTRSELSEDIQEYSSAYERTDPAPFAVNKAINKYKGKLPGLKIVAATPSETDVLTEGSKSYVNDDGKSSVIYVNKDVVDSQELLDETVLHHVLSDNRLYKKHGPRLDAALEGILSEFATVQDGRNYLEDNDIDPTGLTRAELGEQIMVMKFRNSDISESEAPAVAAAGRIVKNWIKRNLGTNISDYTMLTQSDLNVAHMAADLRNDPRNELNDDRVESSITTSTGEVLTSITERQGGRNKKTKSSKVSRERKAPNTLGERAADFFGRSFENLAQGMLWIANASKYLADPDLSIKLRRDLANYIATSIQQKDFGTGRYDENGVLRPISDQKLKKLERQLRDGSFLKLSDQALKTSLDALSNRPGFINARKNFSDHKAKFHDAFHKMRNTSFYNGAKDAKRITSAEFMNKVLNNPEIAEQLLEGDARAYFEKQIREQMQLESTVPFTNEEYLAGLESFLKTDVEDRLIMSRLGAQAQENLGPVLNNIETLLRGLGGDAAKVKNTINKYIGVMHLIKDQAAFKHVFNPLGQHADSRAGVARTWLTGDGQKNLEELKERFESGDLKDNLHEYQKEYMALFVDIKDDGSYTITDNVNTSKHSNLDAAIEDFEVAGLNQTNARAFYPSVANDKKYLSIAEKVNDELQKANVYADNLKDSHGRHTKYQRDVVEMNGSNWRVAQVPRGSELIEFDRGFGDELQDQESRFEDAAYPLGAPFAYTQRSQAGVAENHMAASMMLNAILRTDTGQRQNNNTTTQLGLQVNNDNTPKIELVDTGSDRMRSLFRKNDSDKPGYSRINGRTFIMTLPGSDQAILYTMNENSTLHEELRQPRGSETILGLQNSDSKFARVLLGITPGMASLKTRFNPQFPVLQLIRDTLGAWITQGTNYGFEGLKDFKDAQRESLNISGKMARYMSLRNSNKVEDRAKRDKIVEEGGAQMEEFVEYLNSGGYVSHESSFRRNTRSVGLDNKIVEEFFSGKALDKADGWGRLISSATEITDVWARFAMYKAEKKAALRRGASKGQAIQQAADASKRFANFEQKGANPMADWFKTLYAFYGPAAVGTDQLLSTALRGKYNTEAMYVAAGAAVAVLSMGMLLSGEDEAGNNLFMAHNDGVSDFKFFMGDDGYNIRVAMPFTAPSAVMSTAFQVLKTAMGQQDIDKAVGNTINIRTPHRSPMQDDIPVHNEVGELELGRKFNAFIPTMARPISSLAMNTNHFGYDIVRDPGGIGDTIGAAASIDSNRKQVGSFMEWFTRGLSKNAGIDMDIKFMDFMAREYGSGVYNLIEGMSEIVNAITLQDYDVDMREASLFAGGLFGPTNVNFIQKDYYQKKNRAGGIKDSVDILTRGGMSLEEATDRMDINAKQYKEIQKFLSGHRKKVAPLNKEARTAKLATNYPVDERQRIITGLTEQQTPEMQGLINGLSQELREAL